MEASKKAQGLGFPLLQGQASGEQDSNNQGEKMRLRGSESEGLDTSSSVPLKP